MIRILAVALGGSLGAAARYLAGHGVQRLAGETFPAGTLAVNAIGCFLIGAVLTRVEDGASFPLELRLFLVTGVLGGFTTFSTFGYETWVLLRDGQLPLALLNAGAQLGLGIGGVYLGHVIARIWA